MDGHRALRIERGAAPAASAVRLARLTRKHEHRNRTEGAAIGLHPHVAGAPSVNRRGGRQGWLWSSDDGAQCGRRPCDVRPRGGIGV